ncbi:MAG: helix-turn-helix domain-containing protein [Treponema sp.]|nr:helix-turn-helix domain-containing protein [Treponema sp.]
MYYPIQIPYILSKNFAKSVKYTEETVPHLQDFVICFWEMLPISEQMTNANNVIIADGCIDLVVDYSEMKIGFCGMSKTVFTDEFNSPSYHYGARLKPGAFHVITGKPATEAMDIFLPIENFDRTFDISSFFELPFNEAKAFFKNYIGSLIKDKIPDRFISLFDTFSNDIPANVSEIYQILHYSPKQCQRLFYKHIGLSPQMSLCVIRFQKCLEIITSGKASPNDVLDILNFHDQSHFIKDFKRNIGLTPLELVRKYKS